MELTLSEIEHFQKALDEAYDEALDEAYDGWRQRKEGFAKDTIAITITIEEGRLTGVGLDV